MTAKVTFGWLYLLVTWPVTGLKMVASKAEMSSCITV